MNCNFYENDIIEVNGLSYVIVKLLGKGKGGYSYLCQKDDRFYVLKQIHHEPCSYYNFGNKIEAEFSDYQKLKKAEITIPELIDIDFENERIIKEYIYGQTVFELVNADKDVKKYIDIVRVLQQKAKERNLNIDYFPTNFVALENSLVYVDYECNEYSDKWNFDNWGIKYWSKTPEFIEYIQSLKK